MREDQKIKQHGKDYVLFAGLVAEAHEKFLTWSLEADIDKDSLTLDDSKPRVKAFFSGTYLDKDAKEQRITATGIGTGGRPTDRSGAAADAPIEMAETRAKARALRVAVNIGEAAFEELPPDQGEAEHATPPMSSLQRGQAARAKAPADGKTKASESPAKPDSIRQLRFHADTFAEMRGDDTEEHWEAFLENLASSHDVQDAAALTEGQVQQWISRYQKGIKKLENEGAE